MNKNTYLVLSDLHLDDKFSESKQNSLCAIISKFDNIILNGDTYEACVVEAKQMLNSNYKPLFKLLKSKNTRYLFGNHDRKPQSNTFAQTVSRFQGEYQKLSIGGFKYHIEHGDRLMDKRPGPNPKTYIRKHKLVNFVEQYFPILPWYVGRNWNKQALKNRFKDGLLKQDEILICGHTHVKVFDLKNKYIDTGKTKFGKGNYLIINPKGVKMFEFRY